MAQTVLNSVALQIVVLDRDGAIHSVNAPWLRFALENGTEPGKPARRTEIGINYLEICRESSGENSEQAMEAYNGIKAVLDGRLGSFSLEYPCHSPDQQRWFLMQATPLEKGLAGVVISHTNITDRKQVEIELELHRTHLEVLVHARTADLQKANEAAEVAHRANAESIRKETEARMQSSKLEALGTLAAGIAHDFNNILASIVGFAEMTIDELPGESSARNNMKQILRASFRARDLIALMLTFACQSPTLPEKVDVVAELRETLALLRGSLRPSVRLSFLNGINEQSTAATILAAPTQIQQIVMNLCINASHAMDNHGTICIGIDPACKFKGAPPELLNGICLSVVDSGCGMAPEILASMFNPFFTTKARGEGSGLGLSVVYGIVTGLGGVIKVKSRTHGSNTGTEFQVFLPVQKDTLPTGEFRGAHTID